MSDRNEYSEKFQRFIVQTFFNQLPQEDQDVLRAWAARYRFTFQEIRQVAEYGRDLMMWQEEGLSEWQQKHGKNRDAQFRTKEQLLAALHAYMHSLKEIPKTYPEAGLKRPKKREKSKIVSEHSEKNVFGDCPVASEKTVCCNLKTIDAVESCVFGCSYCTIQTFYRDKITIDDRLGEKLRQLQLDENRYYHIGTGQSSDSLAFGNRNGILDDLAAFARVHPNVILELKTKSNNIRYFLENDVPNNMFCSWSLNPQEVIENEEHFSAGLEDRLKAARRVADRGLKVSFHFHPIVYYRYWATTYPAIARRVQEMFDPAEVLFISFGSVTFIKPVLKKIRKLGYPSKITQMPLVSDPHGKLTYPDTIKIEKFRTMYHAFAPWRDKVFFYLCMEKRSIWEKSFGWVFPDNDAFEQALIQSSLRKIRRDRRMVNQDKRVQDMGASEALR